MLIVIENDGCTHAFLEDVACAFQQRYNKIAIDGEQKLMDYYNLLPEYDNDMMESDENSVFPLDYIEACRYHHQNKILPELNNCIILNNYLVCKSYWPRTNKPDVVFVIGNKDHTSDKCKKISKIANVYHNTRVLYLKSDFYAWSQEERLRMLSCKIYVAVTNPRHVFREDLIASEDV